MIAQPDDHVGAVIAKIEELKFLENSLVIVTSDNGPVLDDGYEDGAVAKNGDHKPAGPFSGGKYSKLEAGTRMPFLPASRRRSSKTCAPVTARSRNFTTWSTTLRKPATLP